MCIFSFFGAYFSACVAPRFTKFYSYTHSSMMKRNSEGFVEILFLARIMVPFI